MSDVTKELLLKVTLDDIKAVKNIEDLKKLQKDLNQQFEKSDIGSDAYKKLEAQVGATRARIKELTDATKAQQNALGGINTSAKFAEGSYGALRQRIQQLKKDLDNAVIGTENYTKVEDELTKALQEQIEIQEKFPSLLSKRISQGIDESKTLQKQADALFKLSDAYETSTDFAFKFSKSLGLPTDVLEKINDFAGAIKTGFDAMKNSVEAFAKENLAAATATEAVAGGQEAITVATEASTEASKIFGLTTKSALIATGVGAFVVLLGAIIANWDKVSAAVQKAFPIFKNFGKIWDEIKKGFMGFLNAYLEGFKIIGEVVKDLFNGDFGDALDVAKSSGQRFAKAFNEGYEDEAEKIRIQGLQKVVDAQNRQISILQAGGKNVDAIQRQKLKNEVEIAGLSGKTSKDYLDKLAEQQAFEEGLRKKNLDAVKASNRAILEATGSARQKELAAINQDINDRLESVEKGSAAEAALYAERNARISALNKKYQQENEAALLDIREAEAKSADDILKVKLDRLDYERKITLQNQELTELQKKALIAKYNKEEQDLVKQDTEFKMDQLLREKEAEANTLDEIAAIEIQKLEEQKKRAINNQQLTEQERRAIIAESEKAIDDVLQTAEQRRKDNQVRIDTANARSEEERLRIQLQQIEQQKTDAINNQKLTEDERQAIIAESDQKIHDLAVEWEGRRIAAINDLRAAQAITEAEQYSAKLEQLQLQKDAAVTNEQLTQEERLAVIADAERQITELRQNTVDRSIELTNEGLKSIQGAMAQNSKTAQAFEIISQKIDAARSLRLDILTLKEQLLGISSQLKEPFPMNIIAVAATIATIGSAIANVKRLVSSSKTPGFSGGGQYTSDGRGDVLPGYSTADNVNARLRSGEGVVVSEAMRNPYARNVISAINVAFGGRDFSVPASRPFFADGGIYDGGFLAQYLGKDVVDSKAIAEDIASAFTSLPSPVVIVDDIDNGLNRKVSVSERANFN
ncbi:hypothetical protein FW774_05895 [Pedobacter sp. BS3]|uniref:hypothetical protein n=1 Tax=Pedobacter sp. BS3 TaxID=2567937 RepID=UPI0011EC8D37|nr:hypothetical protein [Pedobacter sp. BS3]TZF84519.1 hypothetical protein FW774_05895 [Pedobacter sp. BS3]